MKNFKQNRRGFTLVEMMLVILILAIAATMGLDVIGNTEASLRADRAAREALVAIRAARSLAITTGGTFGVEFDVGNNRFQVFNTTGSNVVNQSLISGGLYVINLSRAELNGTTMRPAIANDLTDPYDVKFSGLGNTSNPGTVIFSYAGYKRTLTIPAVGEPTIN